MANDPENETFEEETIRLAEEEVRVGKREVVKGRVRVSTVTEAVEEVAHATLREEAVEVTRVPVDRIVDEMPEVRNEDDLTIVPVVEEVLVLKKQLVVKEELHIRRRTSHEAVEVPVTLRKQRAIVERIPAERDEEES